MEEFGDVGGGMGADEGSEGVGFGEGFLGVGGEMEKVVWRAI